MTEVAKVDWQKVKSSTISAVSYDSASKVMLVRFVGDAVYELSQVPAHRHNAFMHAESKGKYYNEYFKGNARYAPRRLAAYPTTNTVNFTVTGRFKSAPKLQNIPTPADLLVATPLYLALLKTKQGCTRDAAKSPLLPKASMPYLLWCATGKETGTKKRYSACLALIAEASGKNEIGAGHLDGAIALAKERKL